MWDFNQELSELFKNAFEVRCPHTKHPTCSDEVKFAPDHLSGKNKQILSSSNEEVDIEHSFWFHTWRNPTTIATLSKEQIV